jgi:hypothetical protein
MNVNGVYGNGNLKTPEKVNQYGSKEIESTINEYKLSEPIPTIIQSEPTYTDQLQKAPESVQKELVITDEERLKNNFERMTEDDFKELSNEGMTLEEYNIERLERALTRIKKQRAVKEDNLEDQIESNEQKQETIKDMNSLNRVSKKIVEKLMEADLPVTESNVAKIANAMEMAGAASQISDKAMNYLIKTNSEPTIENIYKAQHSGNYSNSYAISEEAWDGLKSKVENVLGDAELDINEENISNAKWLLDNQLPLTEQTLWSLKDLKAIQSKTNVHDILNKVVAAMANGQRPDKASLSIVDEERAKKAIEAFHNISDDAVKIAVMQSSELDNGINCNKLQLAQNLLDTQKTTGVTKTEDEKKVFSTLVDNVKNLESLDIQTIQVRRQLEEIRLKMTVEAGGQLIKKGFHLQTDELSKVIDGLKELENEYYSNFLKEGNATVTSENIDLLKGTLQGISSLKEMPSFVLGSTLSTRNIQTVNSLLLEGYECKQTLDKANQTYEALMTKPRSDMGDSIKKAFQNVDAILEDLDLETTNANQRAVRILGYNGIDITKENIQQVKMYDEQVNSMMKNLHPAVTVELIKEGINPLNIPIQELNQQISKIKNEIGIKDEEKYSKYLWKLEKDKGITEEERKSYIGIYRLVNAVEKSDGAALGAVIKAGQEITMNNLLTAIRTKNSGGIKTAIDDNFGALENITYQKDRIHNQINTAFQTSMINNESSVNQNLENDLTNRNATINNITADNIATENSTLDNATLDNATADNTNANNNIANNIITDNITEQVNYINQLLSGIMDELSPNKLKEIGNVEGILDQSIERLYENLKQAPEDNKIEQEYLNDKLKTYEDIIQNSSSAIKLLEDYNIPNSINNIQAANDVLNKDQSIYKQLQKVMNQNEEVTESKDNYGDAATIDMKSMSDKLIQSMNSPEEVQVQYESIDVDVNNFLNKIYENTTISSDDITTLKRINNGISFINKLARRECYEIPITLGDKITNVNVTFVRNTDMNGKLDIKFSSDVLGDVTMNLSVKDEQLKGLILCDNRNTLSIMESSMESIKTAITDAGVEVKQLNCSLEQRSKNLKIDAKPSNNNYKNQFMQEVNNKSNETSNSNISTERLYSVAKSLLISLKDIEIKCNN